MCVVQLWNQRQNGVERPLAQPLDGAVQPLARAGDVRVGEVAEEVALVEDEAPGLVAVRRRDREQRRVRGIELGVPVQVAVAVRVEAGDHRRRGGSSPRRGADRLVEAHAAGRELVDRRRGNVRAVAADVVDAQRVRDPDDEVHPASLGARLRPRMSSGHVEPQQLEHGRRDVE